MNTEAYADIDKDYVLEFLNIDFGHLWWLISYVVWKRRYKMQRTNIHTAARKSLSSLYSRPS